MESQIRHNRSGKLKSRGGQKSVTFDELVDAKQKLLHGGKIAQQVGIEEKSNSGIQSINTSNTNEIFGDAYTHANIRHPKITAKLVDEAAKFLNDDNNNVQPVQMVDDSFADSVRDQFSSALLRLQSSLERTDQRIATIEARLNSITSQNTQRDQSTTHGLAKSQLNKYLSTIGYFGWPVVVFLAMRGLERRRAITAEG